MPRCAGKGGRGVAGAASSQHGLLVIVMFLSAIQVSYAEIGASGADAQQQSGGKHLVRNAARPAKGLKGLTSV